MDAQRTGWWEPLEKANRPVADGVVGVLKPTTRHMRVRRPISAASFLLPTKRLALATGTILMVLALCAPAQEAAPAETPEYYVVKKGDSFGTIAKRFGIAYRDLAAWNGVTDPSQVAPGRRLRLTPPSVAAEVPQPGVEALPNEPARPREPPQSERTSEALAQTDPKTAAAPVKPKGRTKPRPAARSADATAPAAAPSPTEQSAAEALADRQKQEIDKLRATTGGLIQLLLSEGVITRGKAEELMRKADLGPLPVGIEPASAPRATQTAAAPEAAAAEPRKDAPEAPKPAPGVVRVPYVPEVVKNEIRDQIKEEVVAQAKAERWAVPNALPEWIDRFAFEGDLRFRYQGNFYQDSNPPALVYNTVTGANISNTTNDETWWRIRARLGVKAQLSQELNAKVSIATGNAQQPISLNQDFGNYFSGYSIQLDNAYVRYDPKDWLRATLGRMPNPFFSTELVWWDDLVMDGLAATARPQLGRDVRGFFTAGGFLVQTPQSNPATPDPRNKYMLGVQAGADWDLSPASRLKVGLALYDFKHMEGIPNPTLGSQIYDWTAPKFRQKGNSVFNIDNDGNANTNLYGLVSKFREVNLTAALDLMQFDPYLIRLTGDYVKNIGFDQAEILGRTGFDIDARTSGYQGTVQFGKAELKSLHDWQVFFTYRYLQRDAVLDAFNDPDFHLGGTDTKGYTIGLRYSVGSNAWFRLRWMSADEIDGPPLSIDVLQLDFNARF